MTVRARLTILAVVLLAVAPAPVLAGICFNVTGLPEGASLDLNLVAAGAGHAAVVGDAQGVCGLGQPHAVVNGTVIVDPNGAARVGIKMLSSRTGCSSAEGEFALLPPYTAGTGQIRLPEGSMANVNLTVDPSGKACQLRGARPAACVGNATTLCLLQNRFRAVASAQIQGQSVPAQAVRHSSEFGYFSLPSLDPSNVEVVLKVLDGRPVNAHYWVVATPRTTSVEYTLTVTDTMTGVTKTYSNPAGPLGPVNDTSAFPAP
jgi:hypothetical protein